VTSTLSSSGVQDWDRSRPPVSTLLARMPSTVTTDWLGVEPRIEISARSARLGERHVAQA
jgi:hypothetical protein